MESRISNPCDKIAAFDLDHTLIKPKGNTKFSKDKDDVQLCYPEIKNKLQKLKKEGYKIVIFTNQKGMGKKISKEDIYHKINNYLPYGKDIDVYISYSYDKYRKPCLGMFDSFKEHNGEIKDIFYVGDAAGRENDFSDSDKKFAYNAKIKYFTPEEYFLNRKIDIPKIELLKTPSHKPIGRSIPEKTVILLVGMPATGKTKFAEMLREKYNDVDIISNDITGSTAKSYREFQNSLKADSPRIIIDNTNATKLNRVIFIEIAKNYNYKVFAIQMDLDYIYAQYLNWYRAYTENKEIIPEIAYKTYLKNFEPLDNTEGYDYTTKYIPKLKKKIFKYAF